MNPIRCLVVDDEALARDLLCSLVERDPELSLAGICENGASALNSIEAEHPDLVLLDIQMPVMTGLEMVTKLLADRGEIPYIVFVTAYDEYAIQAFELNVLDYLIKPIQKARFAETIHRAKEAIKNRNMLAITEKLVKLVENRNSDQIAPETSNQARITVRKGDEIRALATDDIIWVEAANQYIKIHCNNHSYIQAQSLTLFSAQIDHPNFIRVHRSSLINSMYLQRVVRKPDGSYRLVLQGDVELRLARNRRDLLPLLLERC